MTTIDESDLFYPRILRRNNYPKSTRGEYYTDYSAYRESIRQDCIGRCVYCDCHENENGGAQHMNLDHFRPKSLPRFSHLYNSPENLVWACAGCNRLKGDFWPDSNIDDSVVDSVGLVEPFIESYRVYFDVQDNGYLVPKKAPAKFMIELLGLNRISKSKIRELRLLKCKLINQFDEHIALVCKILENLAGDEHSALEAHLNWLIETHEIILSMLDFSLYPLQMKERE